MYPWQSRPPAMGPPPLLSQSEVARMAMDMSNLAENNDRFVEQENWGFTQSFFNKTYSHGQHSTDSIPSTSTARSSAKPEELQAWDKVTEGQVKILQGLSLAYKGSPALPSLIQRNLDQYTTATQSILENLRSEYPPLAEINKPTSDSGFTSPEQPIQSDDTESVGSSDSWLDSFQADSVQLQKKTMAQCCASVDQNAQPSTIQANQSDDPDSLIDGASNSPILESFPTNSPSNLRKRKQSCSSKGNAPKRPALVLVTNKAKSSEKVVATVRTGRVHKKPKVLQYKKKLVLKRWRLKMVGKRHRVVLEGRKEGEENISSSHVTYVSCVVEDRISSRELMTSQKELVELVGTPEWDLENVVPLDIQAGFRNGFCSKWQELLEDWRLKTAADNATVVSKRQRVLSFDQLNVSKTRSGRQVIKPLQWWERESVQIKGDKAIYTPTRGGNSLMAQNHHRTPRHGTPKMQSKETPKTPTEIGVKTPSKGTPKSPAKAVKFPKTSVKPPTSPSKASKTFKQNGPKTAPGTPKKTRTGKIQDISMETSTNTPQGIKHALRNGAPPLSPLRAMFPPTPVHRKPSIKGKQLKLSSKRSERERFLQPYKLDPVVTWLSSPRATPEREETSKTRKSRPRNKSVPARKSRSVEKNTQEKKPKDPKVKNRSKSVPKKLGKSTKAIHDAEQGKTIKHTEDKLDKTTKHVEEKKRPKETKKKAPKLQESHKVSLLKNGKPSLVEKLAQLQMRRHAQEELSEAPDQRYADALQDEDDCVSVASLNLSELSTPSLSSICVSQKASSMWKTATLVTQSPRRNSRRDSWEDIFSEDEDDTMIPVGPRRPEDAVRIEHRFLKNKDIRKRKSGAGASEDKNGGCSYHTEADGALEALKNGRVSDLRPYFQRDNNSDSDSDVPEFYYPEQPEG